MSYTPNQYQETIISSVGTINNLVAFTDFIKFTGAGSLVLTGKDSTNTSGSPLILRNETGENMTLIHLSSSSSTHNQFYISDNLSSGQSVPLPNEISVLFYYSIQKGCWVMDNHNFFPLLIGKNNQVVLSVGDGTINYIDTVEIGIINVSITTTQTAAQLNTLYPNVPALFTVNCPNITGGGLAYVCYDAANKLWMSYPLTLVS